ncbi:MAG: valine--pyruvate transaminase [Gammaproteobacteria bacterium]|nr:valine--pyruvate transaminase [Gammaproteobacteria bacterium]
MKLSQFGARLTGQSGTLQLMDDLGQALASGGDLISLGGGNPGRIPEMEEIFRARLHALAQSADGLDHVAGNYDGPAGDGRFLHALAALLRDRFGWSVGPENIAITNGSQSAFFLLFNMLGGLGTDGVKRQILLPLAPEYIGYADVGVTPDLFRSQRSTIEHLPGRQFKYRVDLDGLAVDDRTAAICVSRPTNPTGNVLTDEEVASLSALAKDNGIPFILDAAYGVPFPGIVFTETTPIWDEHIVLCLSLSKLGLPGLRTGIVIANEEVIRALSSLNAVLCLAPGSIGPGLMLDLVESGQIMDVSERIIRPFYKARSTEAATQLLSGLDGYDVFVHKPEGAMFLWLWCRGLPITNVELYERLKARGVIVVSGNYFFPGLQDDWQHRHECIRITYTQPWEKVTRGLEVIAEEVRRAYDERT